MRRRQFLKFSAKFGVGVGIMGGFSFSPLGAANSGENTASNLTNSAKISPDINDGFIFLKGGKFIMESPQNERLRSDDETQHDVELSPFL